MPLRKINPLLKTVSSALIEMPAPKNISVWWNFGSLLGLCLALQIVSGLLISLHYSSSIDHAFSSVIHLCRDVNYGCFFRTLHANGASMFFICIYLHVARGLYYGSYLLRHTWYVGASLLLISMATAFLGYVLPWGQMSFWGATVITNLLSTIPYVGTVLVQWLWGGFAVDAATLSRFFSFHFILPFIMSALVIVHILFLHQTGSSNPLGLKSSLSKIYFHPYYTLKDLVGGLSLMLILLLMVFYYPYSMGDPENFNPANPLVTPPHIQPECYYLFAYAILRSIPNKLGGVIALGLSIMILYILPFLHRKNHQSMQFYPLNQMLICSFFAIAALLTWIGARPVEDPYILTGQILTFAYFSYFIVEPIIAKEWDKMLH